MVKILKQNGHPVSLKGISFICKEKQYPKEACDIHIQYSTIFPLSSNKNCRTNCFIKRQRSSYPGRARQALSTHLSFLWPKSDCCTQLDPAHHTGSKLGHRQGVAYMPLSKAVLSSLPSCQYRGFRTVSSLSAGYQSPGPLHSPVVSVYDRNGSRSTCRFGLENRQKYRQNAFRNRIRSARL